LNFSTPAESLAHMKNNAGTRRKPIYLGIEAGGTRTVALLGDSDGFCQLRLEVGPANLRLLEDARLVRHFRSIAASIPQPDAVVIGMAGARTDADKKRIRDAAAKVWPRVPCYATNDLETALMAASEPTGRSRQPMPRVLVLSGTGSCCFGRAHDGTTGKVGGWGHILGDKGSGFEIGLRALKAVVYYFDRDGEWSELGQRILRVLQLNEPNDLIGWAQNASKTSIAALAIEVFQAWAAKDRIATDILKGASESLARDAVSCATRLAKGGTPIQFVLAGSVLLKQPRFAKRVGQAIQRRWKGAILSPLTRESAEGAVELARRMFPPASLNPADSWPLDGTMKRMAIPTAKSLPADNVASIALSPTEQRNPRSMNLDRMPVGEAIEMMLREDERLPQALADERAKIERGVKLIVRSFKAGGRLFYVGAGTSGRLGILDASECPPTFRTDPELVQGIIAGGQTAIWQAVEGAEDDPLAGARAVEFRGITRHDTVVGIAASGRTPFVWGALREAKRRGAATVLLCFNPNLIIPRADQPTLVIAPKIGPEILTGSTRLKSGTATKLILNIFTTLAMVRMGKVLGNLMIDVKATNVKLRDRAVRIVRELTGVDYARAEAALERTGWRIKPACARLGLR
jgi:N-acetylmuramic acid 6-phosphate etherase